MRWPVQPFGGERRARRFCAGTFSTYWNVRRADHAYEDDKEAWTGELAGLSLKMIDENLGHPVGSAFAVDGVTSYRPAEPASS